MKTILRITFLFLLATGIASAQTVDEVISKHIAAMGGKEKLAALQTAKITSSLDMQGMKLPIIVTVVNNKSVRSELTFQGMTQVSAMTGGSGWYISPFQGKTEPEKMNEEMLRESKEQTDLSGPLFNYKEKGNAVELTGKEEMEGTDVFKLKVTLKSGNVVYQYLDATSYLMLKETKKQKFEDKEIESETLYSNYKMVDGINYAYAIEIRQVGESSGQTMTVENVELNLKVDESIFAMPEAKK
ncbi:MAG TPA: outer membrane lipoprotein-sorting protein [Bacteroidia bacterium]|nr:outer membrane lipoprotein-sorting protein [Bacteroidia bacterium]